MERIKTGEDLMNVFHTQYETDEESFEKKGARLMSTYINADDNGKALIDDIFITLCGYSLKSLIEFQED